MRRSMRRSWNLLSESGWRNVAKRVSIPQGTGHGAWRWIKDAAGAGANALRQLP